MSRQEKFWREEHVIAVPSKIDLIIVSALPGNLTIQITVTILHSCTETTILSEALNSEIKWS